MKTKFIAPLFALALLSGYNSFAQVETELLADDEEWTSARPDGHAPISVLGDHYHPKGDVMFSYRYMPMWMDGTLSGTSSISADAVQEVYFSAPLEMQTDQHMFGAMYAVSDRFTLLAMGSYLNHTMMSETGPGSQFTTNSGGLGDINLTGLIKLRNANRQSWHANIGVSLPTGDIDQRDRTPVEENAELSFPMQLGSGTVDPIVGLTYLGQADKVSWGAQSRAILRLADNADGYHLGNRLEVVGWGAYKASDVLSFSLSTSFYEEGKTDGTEADYNEFVMPLYGFFNTGRKQLDVGLGSNISITEGTFSGLRFAAEYKLPVYQEVNGVQLGNTQSMVVGLQYTIAADK